MAYLETGDVEKWLRQTLLNVVGAAGVYGYRIPKGSAKPCVVFSLVTGSDENSADGSRGATRFIYLIKAIDQNEDSAPADALMKLVDAVLQKNKGSVPGLNILACVRESVIKYPELFEGVNHWHIGGEYRIWGEMA